MYRLISSQHLNKPVPASRLAQLESTTDLDPLIGTVLNLHATVLVRNGRSSMHNWLAHATRSFWRRHEWTDIPSRMLFLMNRRDKSWLEDSVPSWTPVHQIQEHIGRPDVSYWLNRKRWIGSVKLEDILRTIMIVLSVRSSDPDRRDWRACEQVELCRHLW